jgi:hypothetical protein
LCYVVYTDGVGCDYSGGEETGSTGAGKKTGGGGDELTAVGEYYIAERCVGDESFPDYEYFVGIGTLIAEAIECCAVEILQMVIQIGIGLDET